MAEEREKEEAIRELTGMVEVAKKVEADAKELARKSREVSDTVPLVCDIIAEIPAAKLPSEQLSELARGAREFLAKASQIPTFFTSIGSYGALSGGVTNTASTFVYGHQVVFVDMPLEKVKVIQEKKDQLSKFLEKSNQIEQAKESFRRLGLNVSNGTHRLPKDLLAEAAAGLTLPVLEDGRPTSVLIPLRECIDTMFSMLILRRPVQEDTKKKVHLKVESLGRHCGRDGLSSAHFDQLGKTGSHLHDDLSQGKQQPLTRSELWDYYHRSLIFLNTFMDSIDEKKLKSLT